MKSEIIEQFLEGMPKWIENMRKMHTYSKFPSSGCVFCGISPDLLEKLANEISELYGDEWMYVPNPKKK